MGQGKGLFAIKTADPTCLCSHSGSICNLSLVYFTNHLTLNLQVVIESRGVYNSDWSRLVAKEISRFSTSFSCLHFI